MKTPQDVAARLANEPVNLTQAKAGSLTHRFGRKKGVEGAFDDISRHALSSVGSSNEHVLPRWDADLPVRCAGPGCHCHAERRCGSLDGGQTRRAAQRQMVNPGMRRNQRLRRDACHSRVIV
jgi:hypothetical protein